VTPGRVAALLRLHGIRAGRRLGQHFLVDQGVLARIVAALGAPPGAPVLEVGPGLGVLTTALLAAGARVTAVEIDRALRAPLLDALGGEAGPGPGPWLGSQPAENPRPGLRLVWGDAVRLPWAALAAAEPGPWRLCSNLPYYVTGPFLASFLEGGLPWVGAVLLLQQEAARRMLAPPGGSAYGAFSCLVQYHARGEILFRVPRRAFLPPPAVDSVVVRLSPHAEPPTAAPREVLLPVVRAAFAQRRKMLRNALAAGLHLEPRTVDAALLRAGLDGGRRAETLTLAEFGALAQALGGAPPLP
jgi:16S rRNA (adenine1518-N6/adenine1519-N6)-dimethyltransferase